MSAEYARMVHVTVLMLTAAQREPRLRLCPSSSTIDRGQPIRNIWSEEAHHQFAIRRRVKTLLLVGAATAQTTYMHHSTNGCVF